MTELPLENDLRSMLNEGQTIYQISRQFNMIIKEVFKLCKDHDLLYTYQVPIPTKQDLESMYTDEHLTQKQISLEFGVGRSTVYEWIQYYNIPTRGPRGTIETVPPKEVLQQMYTDKGMTQEQIGSKFSVHWHTVGNWLRNYHIPTRGVGTLRVPIPPKSELLNYIGEGLNQHQIAEECKVCDWKIYDWCEHYDIPGMVNGYRCMTPEHINWRDKVLARDNYICQECGSQDNMQAHHIKPYCDYPELELDVDNGITLCEECHRSIRGREYDYIEYFVAITQSRG